MSAQSNQLNIEFVWQSKRWQQQSKIKKQLRTALNEAYAFALKTKLIKKQSYSLTLVFTHDNAVKKLNAEWRFKDKATNVLSFPSVPMPQLYFIGDIIFSYQTIQNEAKTAQKDLIDHLTHLTVHGFLHLIGLDHETDQDADTMEIIETKILKKLGLPNPYHLQDND